MIKDLVLLDTSAWIAADRPKYNQDIKEMVEKLLDEDRIAICGIIMTELLSGTKTLKEYDELDLNLTLFVIYRPLNKYGLKYPSWRLNFAGKERPFPLLI